MVNILKRTSHFGERGELDMAVVNKYRETLEKALWKKVCDLVKGINEEHPLCLCLLWEQGDLICKVEGGGHGQSGWYPVTKWWG